MSRNDKTLERTGERRATRLARVTLLLLLLLDLVRLLATLGLGLRLSLSLLVLVRLLLGLSASGLLLGAASTLALGLALGRSGGNAVAASENAGAADSMSLQHSLISLLTVGVCVSVCVGEEGEEEWYLRSGLGNDGKLIGDGLEVGLYMSANAKACEKS